MPVDALLLRSLLEWKQQNQFNEPEDWIFASSFRIGRLPVSYPSVWRHFQEAAGRAGIPRFGVHSLRHSYRSWLDALGTGLAVQQKLMRHADIRTTMNVYGELYSSHLSNRVGRNHPQPDGEAARWLEKKFDLLVRLVYEIGQSLGYDQIDEAMLRDATYVPQGYQDVESEMHQIRSGWLQVLNGQRPIAMTMVGPVQVERPLQALDELPLPQAPAQPALPPVAPNSDGEER